MKTLEILIPTYGRPDRAAKALETILSCKDNRFRIRCNSNGFEPMLEKFRAKDSRLFYDCFEKNLGPHKNFKHLLENADSKFCMLLSDEDVVDPECLSGLLDFLDGCSNNTAVVACSIYDVCKKEYYFQPPLSQTNACIGLDDFLILNPIPTYMSGLVFSNRMLRDIDLDYYYCPVIGNAYSHLDIAQELLVRGVLRFYIPKLVLKGDDVKFGGDGYSHRMFASEDSATNLDLNPLVYGPYARARQFYYRERLLINLRKHAGVFSYAFRKINICSTFLRAVANSSGAVVLPSHVHVAQEAERATFDAKSEGDYSGTFTAKLFERLVSLPPPVSNFLGVALGIGVVAIRKIFLIRVIHSNGR